MSKMKKLSIVFKIIIIIMALLGCLLYFVSLPGVGSDLFSIAGPFADFYIPWKALMWLLGIPCFIVLVIGWMVSDSIGKEDAFTLKNAKRFNLIAILAFLDSAILFVCDIVYFIIGLNFLSFFIMMMVIVFIGVVIGFVAKALAFFLEKAADLQDEVDFTI